MATVPNANITQKWADDGYWNAETNDKAIYAGYATANDINYVARIRILMPGAGVSAQIKIAYKHSGSLNGKQLKYKITKSEQDTAYKNANVSTAGDGTVTIAAASGHFTINYSGSFSAGDYLYIYLWTAGSTSVYTLCNILAVANHSCTYTEGTASTLSKTGTTIGSAVTFGITSNNSGFTHTLIATFGTYSKTILSKSSDLSASWTPTLSEFGALIPNGTKITGTFTLTTYNGSTVIGSPKTYDHTLNLPASVVPSLSGDSVVVSPVSNNYAVASWGLYVQNLTWADVTIPSSAHSGAYGSTISSISVEVDGSTSTSSSPSSNVTLSTKTFSASGTKTIRITVTDSRGRTASATKQVYVQPYAAPGFKGYSCFRSDSAGTATDEGSYVTSYADVAYSSCGGKNTVYITLTGVVADSSAQLGSRNMTNQTTNIWDAGLSTEKTYKFTMVVEDAVGNLAEKTIWLNATAKHDFVIMPGHVNMAAFFTTPTHRGLTVPEPIYAQRLDVGGYGDNGDLFLRTVDGDLRWELRSIYGWLVGRGDNGNESVNFYTGSGGELYLKNASGVTRVSIDGRDSAAALKIHDTAGNVVFTIDANSNFAPGDRGIGDVNWLSNSTDIDTVQATGVYSYSDGNTSPNIPSPLGELIAINRTGNIGTQFAIDDNYPHLRLMVRKRSGGTWQAWEWVNPPMVLGVEYRTTERSGGNPVYVMRVAYTNSAQIGNASGIATVNIPHGISGFGELVRVAGRNSANYPIPYIGSTGGITVINAVNTTNVQLRIKEMTWASGYTWYFDVYYTK